MNLSMSVPVVSCQLKLGGASSHACGGGRESDQQPDNWQLRTDNYGFRLARRVVAACAAGLPGSSFLIWV